MSLLDRCLEVGRYQSVERPPRPTGRRLKDRLTDDDRRSLVEVYRSGATTMNQLAERYGISDYSVRLVLRQAGVVSSRALLGGEVMAAVRELREQSLSVAQIAIRLGIAETSVRLLLATEDG